MRTRLTLRSGRTRGIHRKIALAARCKSTVVFFMAGAPTDRTDNTWRLADCGRVISLTALLTGRNACMNMGRTHNTGEALYKK